VTLRGLVVGCAAAQFRREAASLNDRRTGCWLDVSIYLFSVDLA